MLAAPGASTRKQLPVASQKEVLAYQRGMLRSYAKLSCVPVRLLQEPTWATKTFRLPHPLPEKEN